MQSPRQSRSIHLLSSSFGGYQAHDQPGSTVLLSPLYGATPFFLLSPPPLRTALTTHLIRISSSYVLFSLKPPLLSINSSFQRPVPYWCWISGGDLERILGEYLWLGIGVLVSVVLYTLLFFRLRGNILVDPQNWKNIHVQLRRDSDAKPSVASREAMGAVIWYPICYSIVVGPLFVVRWWSFHPPKGFDMPFIATATVITVFGFSGAVSVLLILLTRRGLLLLGPSRGPGVANY